MLERQGAVVEKGGGWWETLIHSVNLVTSQRTLGLGCVGCISVGLQNPLPFF